MALITFFVPYFGQSWPPWFPAFIRSCETNKTCIWLFFTNISPPDVIPNNVKFHPMTFDELNHLVSSKLGAEVEFQRGIKLVDLKPAYADIFGHFLQTEFWGFCDIDVVWGNFESIILGSNLLKDVDIFSPRKDFIAGHLCVLRNQHEINTLYRRIEDFQRLLTCPEVVFFDEGHFATMLRSNLADSLRIKWDKNLYNFAVENDDTSDIDFLSDHWRWEKGSLFVREETTWREILYLHFRTWKSTLLDCCFGYQDSPDSFYVSFSHIRQVSSRVPWSVRRREVALNAKKFLRPIKSRLFGQ